MPREGCLQGASAFVACARCTDGAGSCDKSRSGVACCCLNRKLVELERELRAASAKRHAYAEGRECCCCTCVFHSYVIPAYVLTWDL